MLPRWHIILGAGLTAVFWLASPNIPKIYLALVFLSSFLIDFDHYLASVFKTKDKSLRNSSEYHSKEQEIEKKEIAQGIRKKSDFHLFHTIEFHLLVGFLGILWIGFFYVFIGMLFHSLVDVFDLISRRAFHRREYFFFNWLRKKF